jgi:hypothetical protein
LETGTKGVLGLAEAGQAKPTKLLGAHWMDINEASKTQNSKTLVVQIHPWAWIAFCP